MIATVWLVVRGGDDVGQHLSLLSFFLPGYRVTWAGSLLGLVYGFVLGGVVGWSLVWVYNRIVDLKYSERRAR